MIMKKFLKIFIPLAVVLGLIYQFRLTLLREFSPVIELAKNNWSNVFPAAPCAKPIPYRLGSFATQFGISQKYFLSALSEAEAIWEKPFGR